MELIQFECGTPVAIVTVVRVKITAMTTLKQHYMPFVQGGGLYLTGAVAYQLGEKILLVMILPDAEQSLPVLSRVIWSNRHSLSDRPAGCGVQFLSQPGSPQQRIESLLGMSSERTMGSIQPQVERANPAQKHHRESHCTQEVEAQTEVNMLY